MKRFGCFFPCGVLLLMMVGCASNLQSSYVDSMEAYEAAVQADVDAGLYQMDEMSQKSFDAFKKANDDARKVLDAEQYK